MNSKQEETLGDIFETRTESIEAIFSSYRDLYSIYATVLKTANANKNALLAFDNAKKSAETKQKRIANQLYSQGFVLLSGACEALLKDVFECLLVQNFIEIKGAKNINFSIAELQRVFIDAIDDEYPLGAVSHNLGATVVNKMLEGNHNQSKVKFQNVQSLRESLRRHFDIILPDNELMKRIHRYWQVRHCIVHTNSRIDKRFINNVSKVDLLKEGESVGKAISVTKDDYTQARRDFTELFSTIDNEINRNGLSYGFVAIMGLDNQIDEE